MAASLLAALAIAAAAAAAADAAEEPQELELSEHWLAPESADERPDVRSWKQRRRAARDNALGWMNSPVDDRELAYFVSQDKDPAALVDPEAGGAILADGAEVVWNRPSLLTLGQVPGQPAPPDWLRWQAAILRAREKQAARQAEAEHAGEAEAAPEPAPKP